MKLPTSDRPFLTIARCCEILGLTKTKNGKVIHHRNVIDEAIRTGRLKSYVIARGKRKKKIVIHPDDLAKFLQEREYKPERRTK